MTYQVFKGLSLALKGVEEDEAGELAAIASRIEADFKHYMLKTNTVPGFIYMEQPNRVEYMLHTDDTNTGIHYRLLPMTRSMISELLTPEQAEAHYQIIKEKLDCPDGVRLMNRPANYTGGVSTHFKRAEQAANFGREIGLQYVHAHIRFVEAMAKLGKEEDAWSGLAKINPIGIQEVVPNAERRQSNAYFSSSDGKFNTRYAAQARFDELKAGTVPVKGGWRIYSSGPGIYMNQLISNCLGIRSEADVLIIDPVLPKRLSGMKFQFAFDEYPVTYTYYFNQKEPHVTVNGAVVRTEAVNNRYRQGGFRILQSDIASHLTKNGNVIDIYL